MLRGATKDLGRLRQIAGVIAKYGYGEFIRRSPELKKDLGEGVASSGASPAATPVGAGPGATPVAGKPPSADTAPRRFRMMLEELGPTFIKFGQVMSARPDLISRAYVDELKSLQNQCEPLPFADIERAIADGLGAPPSELFSELSREPLATASIAQVHRGRTRSGEEVVVKVQRPGIAEAIRSDVEILYRFAKLLDSVIEESAMTEPVGIVRELDRALVQELDFTNEAANLREFKKLHEPRTDIVIPAVYPEMSSSTVLTMQFLKGVPFTRLPANADKKTLAERVVREAFDEVFIDGVFHADPHPGNLMLLDDGRYGILDLGLLGRLTPQMRDTLVVLVLAIAMRDADTVARTFYRLGQGDQRVNIAAVRDDTVMLFDKYLHRSIKDVESTVLMQELLNMGMKHRTRLPAEYTMLARAAGTIEGLVRELDPDIDVAKVATPYAEKLLLGRVAPDNVQGGLYRALLQFQGMSQDLPMQASQILNDLSSGNFTVNVSGRHIERLTTTLLVASTMIGGSIIGAAFIVGTFIALAGSGWKFLGIPVVALVGAMSALMIISWLGIYAAVRPRLKKISIRRFLFRGRPQA
ncbi:AarF/ABC1/UbiB kinase family protein [Myxococcota bacterium]|nr:AarF/ABC1/UbiB kinase family protein [Myxococcota bacterium]